jgi:hypothetical protein
MKILPSLDAHAHLDPARANKELANSGAVLAMTFSLDQATRLLLFHVEYSGSSI